MEKCANTEWQLAMQMKKNITILPELTVTLFNKFERYIVMVENLKMTNH